MPAPVCSYQTSEKFLRRQLSGQVNYNQARTETERKTFNLNILSARLAAARLSRNRAHHQWPQPHLGQCPALHEIRLYVRGFCPNNISLIWFNNSAAGCRQRSLTAAGLLQSQCPVSLGCSLQFIWRGNSMQLQKMCKKRAALTSTILFLAGAGSRTRLQGLGSDARQKCILLEFHARRLGKSHIAASYYCWNMTLAQTQWDTPSASQRLQLALGIWKVVSKLLR